MADHPSKSGGFGHSPKRIAVEIGGAVVALALLLWLGYAALGWIAAAGVGLIPKSVDEAIGEASWEQLAPESARCENPEAVRYVETLAAPILEHLDTEFEFKFAVVDSDQINAFALPGGYVTVNMGLLEAAETGEEVAAVLAHEMIHVTERHGTQRIVRQVGGVVALGLLLGWLDVGPLIEGARRLMGQAYDRDQERESDALGRELLLAANIDPGGMETFFRRLQEEGGPTPPLILSTHPPSEERAETAAAGEKLAGPARALPPPGGVRCN